MVASSALGNPTYPRTQVLRIARDHAIYMEGDDALTWYAVAEGVVRSCRFDAEGNRQVTGFHFAGDVFGLDTEVRLDTAEAVTDAQVWCLPHDPGAAVTAEHFGKALWKALSRVRATSAVLGRRLAHERLAAFILMVMHHMDPIDLIEFPMSRNDIADYLGLTYHTVSRGLGQLCDEGLIAMAAPSRCRVSNVAGLRSLAGETV